MIDAADRPPVRACVPGACPEGTPLRQLTAAESADRVRFEQALAHDGIQDGAASSADVSPLPPVLPNPDPRFAPCLKTPSGMRTGVPLAILTADAAGDSQGEPQVAPASVPTRLPGDSFDAQDRPDGTRDPEVRVRPSVTQAGIAVAPVPGPTPPNPQGPHALVLPHALEASPVVIQATAISLGEKPPLTPVQADAAAERTSPLIAPSPVRPPGADTVHLAVVRTTERVAHPDESDRKSVV